MSITRDQFLQYIDKPALLREQTIAELKEIIDEFPYFQSAQLLYTYDLFSQANFRFASYLKTCSIYATDRTVLYRLLQVPNKPETSLKKDTAPPILQTEASSLFELADERQITGTELPRLSATQAEDAEGAGFDLLSFEQGETMAFPMDDSVKKNDDTGLPDSGRQADLIEQFIRDNPTIQPRTDQNPPHIELDEPKDDQENDKDEYITETLSRIYLKQGHYQKAIDSFQRLSLKFPEKSIYFAQQIEEIKKLLN